MLQATGQTTTVLQSPACDRHTWLSALMSPPALGSPQITRDPSDFAATNAPAFAQMLTMPVCSCSATPLESPPTLGSPQVTTCPLSFNAAKANSVLPCQFPVAMALKGCRSS